MCVCVCLKVDIAYCGVQSYSDQKRQSMTLAEFLTLFQSTQKNHPKSVVLEFDKSAKLPIFDPKTTENVLYCKDWHIVRDLVPKLVCTFKLVFCPKTLFLFVVY